MLHNNIESSDSEGISSEMDTTERALAAAIKSVKSHKVNNKLHCEICKRDGHTEDKYWQNPDIPDNKIPPTLQELLAAQAIKDGGVRSSKTKGSGKSGKVEIAGATVEKTTISPPADHRSYADSGATAHCFHSKFAFVHGSTKLCPRVTVLLANKSSVEAAQCGGVIIPSENANMRLTRVLFIAILGYNLVSTGNLADKRIESHFGCTDIKRILEEKGFFVGSGTRDPNSTMYMVPPDGVPTILRTANVSDRI